jgi:hypothetical protein
LLKLFFDINERIKKYTDGHFEVKNKQLHLKNSNEPLPPVIAKTLLELERSGEDYMPLIRFWRKLSKSPHQNSKEQLYSFIKHNKVQITELGDIVLEKGVSRKAGGMPDELVDARTGTIDHSVGSYVSMPRNGVVDDKNQTCASGLHAAPSEYVRDWYKQNVLVELVVNPMDVVSVPTDYDSRKVRCCAYRVVGYSPKTPRENQIVKLSEFITDIDSDQIHYQEKHTVESKGDKSRNVVKENSSGKVINLGGLSAKAIVALTVKHLKCEPFGGEHPGKAAVLKQASKKFVEKGWTVSVKKGTTETISESGTKSRIKQKPAKPKQIVVNFKELKNATAKEVVKQTMKDLKCSKFGGDVPRKAKALKIAKKLYKEAGWKIK